jgi:hypothetical protein
MLAVVALVRLLLMPTLVLVGLAAAVMVEKEKIVVRLLQMFNPKVARQIEAAAAEALPTEAQLAALADQVLL